MALNVVKGSQTAAFPDTINVFIAQSETLDPVSEDPTLAEGRDANRWSVEVQTALTVLGVGGRAAVVVDAAVPDFDVGSLKYVYQGINKSFALQNGVALTASQDNFIFLDPETNLLETNITGFPTKPILKLARWDDTGGSPVFTDERPHDLGITSDAVAGNVLEFDFNDAPSILLRTIPAGGFIEEIKIKIDIAFTVTTTISVGTDASPELIIATTEIDTQTADNVHSFEPVRKSVTEEDIKIFINNSPAAGTGVAIIKES